MSTLSTARSVLGAAAASLILSACGSWGSQQFAPANVADAQTHAMRSAPPGSSALRADSLASGAASKPMRPDHGASWMAKGAASGALLYLSDYATSDVYVYSWPGLKVVGTLTGFANPQGECVDKSGNVWVTNSSASQLLEYAHGGTSPIASLATPNQYPASCSVNLRTGELAVGSIESTTLGQGGVTLFKNASGSGTFVQSPDIFYVYFVGYDPSGTLYLDGHDANHDFAFDSYRAATFTAMTVSGGNINQPGNLQYADKSMTIGDQNASSGYSAIYAISVSGPSATITGSTTLTRSIDCVQTFIGGKRVVCPDAVGGIYEVFAYPAGGLPKKLITGNFGEPTGAVISQ